MLKKILLGLLVVVLLVAGYLTYFFFIGTRKASPPDLAVFEKEGLKMEISYCQPSKNNRLIFGSKEDDALVPYGELWRTGANAATIITINKDIVLNGEALKAGSYQLFTIPDISEWTIIVNSETGQWGAFTYKPEADVLKTKVSAEKTLDVVEMFKIDFALTDSTSAIRLAWDDTQILIPFE